MDSIENEIKRIKKKKSITFPAQKKKVNNPGDYVNKLIVRLLISVIIFFGIIIVRNVNKPFKNYLENVVLEENLAFTSIKNVYNRYFGNILPFEKILKDEQPVFNEKLQYSSIENYKDGFALTVGENYAIPVISSGVVVFIGEKEGLGNTVIIQGSDEIDYWYSNVDNLSYTLYDYVNAGSLLATSKTDKIYLTFKKGSEYLDFDEVMA